MNNMTVEMSASDFGAAHTYGSRHTWRSVFHHVCSSLKNPASETKVSGFIRVHPRFLNEAIFQTGLTGLTGYASFFNPIPLIIDQHEENLDNQTVFELIVPGIKEAKGRRQIFIVTHNPGGELNEFQPALM